MAGISSKAAGKLENKFKLFGKQMQNQEFGDGSGLDWYDYGMREYDPQIGRFFRVDPISEKFYYLSPYQYCSNNPITNVDLDGAEGLDFRILNKLVENTIKNPDGASAKTLGVVAGVGNFANKTITGLGNLLFGPPPDLSIQGAANAGAAMAFAAIDRINTIKNGSTIEKTAAITETVLDVASIVYGTKGAGGIAKGAGAEVGIANPIPTQLARVIPNSVGEVTTLGRAGSADVFVTASADIKGMNATQIALKLTIPESSTGFKVITFEPVPGIASPINRTNPGFLGGGRTAGGAREFVVPNQLVPKNATIKTVN